MYYDLRGPKTTLSLEDVYVVTEGTLLSLHCLDSFNLFTGDSFSINNVALYGQVGWDSAIVNITAGARYDLSNRYGGALSPRLAAVSNFGPFHVKAMVGQSFRAPGGILPDRVPPGDSITNEKAINIEVESGYQFSKSIYAQLSAYNVRFRDLLEYTASTSGIGGYLNGGSLENRGIEAEFRFKEKTYGALLNYSFTYQAHSDVAQFSVPGRDGFSMGAPQHRLNLFAHYEFYRNMSINPSMIYYGTRFYSGSVDGNGNPLYASYSPTALFNLNFRFKELFMKELELDVGLQNVFDTAFFYAPLYLNNIAPAPGPSRTYSILLAYQRQF